MRIHRKDGFKQGAGGLAPVLPTGPGRGASRGQKRRMSQAVHDYMQGWHAGHRRYVVFEPIRQVMLPGDHNAHRQREMRSALVALAWAEWMAEQEAAAYTDLSQQARDVVRNTRMALWFRATPTLPDISVPVAQDFIQRWYHVPEPLLRPARERIRGLAPHPKDTHAIRVFWARANRQLAKWLKTERKP